MTLRIPPAKVYFSEEDRKTILQQIDETLVSGQLTLGKNVKSFEQCFAEKIGVRYAIAVNKRRTLAEVVCLVPCH